LKTSLPPWFWRFLRLQELFAFIGIIVYSALAAMKVHAPFAAMMICILCVGNVMFPLMEACQPVYAKREFPWDWLILLLVLVGGSLISAVAADILLIWMLGGKSSFSGLFRETAPLIAVVSLSTGIVSHLTARIQGTLRQRNQDLELTVQQRTAALQQQEEELQRARDIQQNLIPKTIPQLSGVRIAGAWQPAKLSAVIILMLFVSMTIALGFVSPMWQAKVLQPRC
jgi:hypothetical protein